MFILRNILTPLQDQFRPSRKGAERGVWFIYTLWLLLPISLLLVPLTCCGVYRPCLSCQSASAGSILSWLRQSSLGNACGALYGLSFREPTVNERLLLVLDDLINPKNRQKNLWLRLFLRSCR